MPDVSRVADVDFGDAELARESSAGAPGPRAGGAVRRAEGARERERGADGGHPSLFGEPAGSDPQARARVLKLARELDLEELKEAAKTMERGSLSTL